MLHNMSGLACGRGVQIRSEPQLEQSKRTFIVEVLIDNPDDLLKPGSYARARLATKKMDEVMVVPQRAVTYILGSNKAFVVTAAGAIDAREVKVGDRLEQQIEILEGLKDGEVVALTQLNRLDTGVKVTIATAPEGRGGEGKGGEGKGGGEAAPKSGDHPAGSGGGKRGGGSNGAAAKSE